MTALPVRSHAAAPTLAGTQPGGLAGGAPFASPAGCQSCHAGVQTADGAYYMPWDTWAGSMMANAARDPLFLASVSVAEQDAPGTGTYCLRCHTPSAFVESRATPGDGSALSAIDREGVHCAVCHRSIDGSAPPTSDAKAPYVGDAQLYFDLGMATESTYRGPYDDPHGTPAHMAVGDAFVGDDSRLCGQCHQVDNPGQTLVDAAGADTGNPFPLDTTYEEWQHSAYATGAGAQSCQSCHMPAETGMWPIATGSVERTDPPRHDFVGGNEWGPALLKAAFPGLRDDAYDRTRAAAQANLKAAAKLEIVSLPQAGPAGGQIALRVRVTNLSGHKLPTGYADGRRAWIEVATITDGGTPEVLSGAYDAATGTLTVDPSLRLYEAVHGRDGSPEDHIALHRQILRDSRIPPRGFQPTPSTAPVGPITFTDGNNNVVPYDEAGFQVKLPDSKGSRVDVRVRLLYQAVTASHVAALAAANTTDTRGADLMRLWQQSGQAAPFMMAEAVQTVDVVVAPSDPDHPQDSGGCSCGVAGTRSGTPALFAAAGLVALVVATRRRRRR